MQVPFTPVIRQRCLFHSSSKAELSGRLKNKIKYLQGHGTLPSKSSHELAKIEAKKRYKLKKLQKSSYSIPQAYHVINKAQLAGLASPPRGTDSNNASGDNISNLPRFSLGPITNDDLQILTKTKDRRLIYTILGVTGEQLRDSKLVYNDIRKFLSRSQLEKALFLAKIAKRRGSAGMNLIMKHYLSELHSPQSAIDLYNWRKKVGIPPNEYTNTILFDGISKQKDPVPSKIGKSVFNIVTRLIDKHELGQIEYNAALGALSNCSDVSYAFKLYNRERDIKGVYGDSITYLWMLRACARVNTRRLFLELFNQLVESIPRHCVDEELLFQVCKTLVSHSDDRDIREGFLRGMCQYYDLPEKQLWGKTSSPATSDVNESSLKVAVPPLEYWGLERKFPLNRHVLSLYMDFCLETKRYKQLISMYKHFLVENREMLDMDMFHKYLKALIQNDPKTCAQECLNAIKEAEQSGLDFWSRHTLVLCYKSFEREASKKAINGNPVRVRELLSTLHGFILEKEGVYSEEFSKMVYTKGAWKFVFPVLDKLRAGNELEIEVLDMMLVRLLESVVSGELDLDTTTNTVRNSNGQQYIELGIIRLLKAAIDARTLADFDTNITKSELPTADQIALTLRRHLLRLKDKYVDHLSLVELMFQGKRDVEGVEELEGDIKELSRLVLSDYKKKSRNEAKQKGSAGREEMVKGEEGKVSEDDVWSTSKGVLPDLTRPF